MWWLLIIFALISLTTFTQNATINATIPQDMSIPLPPTDHDTTSIKWKIIFKGSKTIILGTKASIYSMLRSVRVRFNDIGDWRYGVLKKMLIYQH